MIPQLATGAPGLVPLDLLLGEEDGCDAYVVSPRDSPPPCSVCLQSREIGNAKGRSDRSTTAESARISLTPRLIAFVADLLAVEIIL